VCEWNGVEKKEIPTEILFFSIASIFVEFMSSEKPKDDGSSRELTLDEGSRRLQELITQYKGVGVIPDDQLEEIGYIRDQEGSVRRLDDYHARLKRQEESKNRYLEKIRNAPFGKLEVPLMKAEITGRRINARGCMQFRKEVFKFDKTYEHDWSEVIKFFAKVFPETHLFDFKNDFDQYLLGHSDIIAEKEQEHFSQMLFYWLSTRFAVSEFNDFMEKTSLQEIFFESEYVGEDAEGEDVIYPDKALVLYQTLERARGIYTDTREIEEKYDREITNTALYDSKEVEKFPEVAHIYEYLKKHNIQNIEQTFVHFFGLYFKEKKMDAIADGIEKLKKRKAIGQFLTQECRRIPDDLLQREKELTQRIRGAPVQLKKTLSKDLQEIRSIKKERKQILEGVKDFFMVPELTTEFFNRFINRLQGFLIRKSKEGEAQFYLDATPNSEYDTDPGVVSGDCTAGQPLPFEHPDVPVYNVKVLDAEKKHIGNIYLLVTRTRGEEEPRTVWHFDAIQVPSTINWAESINTIIALLADGAAKKNVDMITVNDEKDLISNYDYIRNAVEKYWQDNGSPVTKIEIPRVEASQKYSAFQGSGDAKVLWQRKKSHDENT
jgi:hypothetical protein